MRSDEISVDRVSAIAAAKEFARAREEIPSNGRRFSGISDFQCREHGSCSGEQSETSEQCGFLRSDPFNREIAGREVAWCRPKAFDLTNVPKAVKPSLSHLLAGREAAYTVERNHNLARDRADHRITRSLMSHVAALSDTSLISLLSSLFSTMPRDYPRTRKLGHEIMLHDV